MFKNKIVLISVLIIIISLSACFIIKKNLSSDDQFVSKSVNQGSTGFVDDKPISSLYTDKNLFLSAIKQVKKSASPAPVNGLIVPHHLLAINLMADTFSYASNSRYKKIVLLSPDHYNLGSTDISVSERNFLTVFGEVKTDSAAVKKLKELPFVSEGDFFYREHGLEAELPFIKYYFPDSEVTAITFKPNTSKEELDKLIAVLEKELPSDSLIVQSTDFSHYLSPEQSAEKDLETIKVLKENDPVKILELKQPDNIDSLAASYIQMSLQKVFFKTDLNILEHYNSQDYTNDIVLSSTSYITAAYINSDPIKLIDTTNDKNNQAELIFVGDVMLSRYIGEMMAQKKDYNFPYEKIQPFLNEADSVFANLESPISDSGKLAGNLYSFRADPQAVSGLKNAGFKILSVANNHVFDYGQAAFFDTLNNLKTAGLEYTGGGLDFNEAHNGAYQEINGTKITYLAYTDLLPKSLAASGTQGGFAYLDLKQMIKDIQAAKDKSDLVIVSFHWGREYETKHNAHQEEIAKAAIEAGASLIIGHHPHVVQDIAEYKGVTIAYSLGNFIFDQNFSAATKNGLALEVYIKDKKIINIEKQVINFNHDFQPYLAN